MSGAQKLYFYGKQKCCLGQKIQDAGISLIWQMNVPLDHQRPWDLRGSLLFLDILKIHHQYCKEFVQSKEFKQYLHDVQADLVIVDHFIQVKC